MKKIKDCILSNSKVISVISCFASSFSVMAANTLCCAIYHQPEKPDMKKFRKF
ncbi:cyclic lactone autoinducer peptide [Lacrimispora sp. 38-1]|uniref:cyclic lactone autoinducer peptide n=1 Tax=Lacrimispora sp. 38-1 TaxID=3125778 RepID=UPI003CEDD7F0